jgi:catechol 2,3-dioxygenase-like lactoylglutathione lyase family enzyme
MKIERIDHLNLTVADIDRSVEFYQRVLGMKTESMGEGRAALYFGKQKIHLDVAKGLHATGGTVAMSGEKRMPAHICFITETPMSEVAAHLETCGVPVRMKGRAPARSARSNRSISTTRTKTRSRSPPTEPPSPA